MGRCRVLTLLLSGVVMAGCEADNPSPPQAGDQAAIFEEYGLVPFGPPIPRHELLRPGQDSREERLRLIADLEEMFPLLANEPELRASFFELPSYGLMGFPKEYAGGMEHIQRIHQLLSLEAEPERLARKERIREIMERRERDPEAGR